MNSSVYSKGEQTLNFFFTDSKGGKLLPLVPPGHVYIFFLHITILYYLTVEKHPLHISVLILRQVSREKFNI